MISPSAAANGGLRDTEVSKQTEMKPEETGSHYNRIALWWQQQHMDSAYGIAALERAIKFVEHRATALDIGCGTAADSSKY